MTEAHYLFSTTIITLPESASAMAALLATLAADSAALSDDESPLTSSVNQSPDDACCFLVFDRFKGADAMQAYQKAAPYQAFIKAAQPLCEKPFGVHICKEVGGKVSMAYHPFGPAGKSHPKPSAHVRALF